MEIILQAAKDAGPAATPLLLVFIALWGLEVKERWRREAEDTVLRRRSVKAQIRLARILTKIFFSLGKPDDELDQDDDDLDSGADDA